MAEQFEYYLLRISYSTQGWDHIVQRTVSFDERMAPVRRLIAELGGSLATFGFYDNHEFKNDALRHNVCCKFAVFGGHDLMAILAMQDRRHAQAFKLALCAQPGIEKIELTAMMPYADVIGTAVPAARDAMPKAAYAGPGTTPPKPAAKPRRGKGG
jgi:uncharacterized protein with GYD domain